MVIRREKTIKRKTNAKEEKLVIPSELPLMPVRDVVVSPSMILPLFVGRERSIRAIEESNKDNRMVFLVAQKQVTRRNPEPEDMYEVGTVAVIMRFLRLPDNRVKILVQGISKARIVEYLQVDPFYRVRIEPIPEPKVTEISIEMEALMRNVKEQSEKILSLRGLLSPDVIKVLGGVEDPIRLADLIVANLRLKVKEAQEIHEINDPIERLQKVNEYLNREGKSALIITHTGYILDYVNATKGCVMMNGELWCVGSPKEMFEVIRKKGYEECKVCHGEKRFY